MVLSLSRRALVGVLSLLVTAACVIVAAPVASALSAAQLSSSLISSVNALRHAAHLPALRIDARLSNRASSHTALIVRTRSISQAFHGEPTVSQRLTQLGYPPATASQVLVTAASQGGLIGQPRLQRGSSRAALLSSAVSDIGVSASYSAPLRGWIATIVLARQQPLTVQAAARVLATLNAERAAHRLPPLTMNSRLVASAHQHNLVMAARNVLSHQLPGEASLGPRLLNVGYRYYYGGENVAWTTDRSVAGLVSVHVAMYNEVPPNDGHRQNILSPNYRNVGIDVVIDAAHGKAWITEDFGRLQ